MVRGRLRGYRFGSVPRMAADAASAGLGVQGGLVTGISRLREFS
ncbi:hypothetical protein [Streptomyces sp. NBC_01451]|nr:hypothetical protein [Streptomyces sp. NBC_01451]